MQPRFTPDSRFESYPALVEAYKLLNQGIDRMSGSNVARLRESKEVEIVFTAGEMTESKGHTTIEAPDPTDGEAWKSLSSLAQYYDLKGQAELRIEIDANATMASKGIPYFILARTLAHELAGHVAPHTDVLHQIRAGRGMSPEDRDRVTGLGGRGGRGEHALMPGGGNKEYDRLVEEMAKLLSRKDARELAMNYLQDISRYEPRPGAFGSTPEERKEAIIRQMQAAAKDIPWVRQLVAEQERSTSGVDYWRAAAILLILGLLIYAGTSLL